MDQYNQAEKDFKLKMIEKETLIQTITSRIPPLESQIRNLEETIQRERDAFMQQKGISDALAKDMLSLRIASENDHLNIEVVWEGVTDKAAKTFCFSWLIFMSVNIERSFAHRFKMNVDSLTSDP